MAQLQTPRQNAEMYPFKRWLTGLLWPALLFGMPDIARAYIDITPSPATITVNWSGGDITREIDLCVVSVAGAQPDGTSPLPYDVRVMSSTGALTIAGPGADVPVGVQWTDLETSSVLTLVHGVVSPRTNTGVIDPCPAGNNARATFTLSANDLYTRAPGTYSANFRFRVRHQAGGVRRDTAIITLNVVVPTVVHLSGLDSFSLGTWSGSGDLSGSDTLCVFINSGALYSVTATGSGVGGVFSVSNGSVPVAFNAQWNDGGGAQVLSPGVAMGNRANANSTSVDCAGGTGNNATFSVTVPAANLQTATGTGTFSGSVTLTVQAQ